MPEAETTLARPHAWRHWFAFLGGGVAWTLHLISIYAIGEFGCVGGWGRLSWGGISGVAWLLIGVTLLLLVPAAAATFVGYRDSRRYAGRSSPAGDEEGGAYLSSFGFLLSGLFTLIIIVEILPVFAYLSGC